MEALNRLPVSVDVAGPRCICERDWCAEAGALQQLRANTDNAATPGSQRVLPCQVAVIDRVDHEGSAWQVFPRVFSSDVLCGVHNRLHGHQWRATSRPGVIITDRAGMLEVLQSIVQANLQQVHARDFTTLCSLALAVIQLVHELCCLLHLDVHCYLLAWALFLLASMADGQCRLQTNREDHVAGVASHWPRSNRGGHGV